MKISTILYKERCFRLLRIISQDSDMSQRHMAEAMETSLGTCNQLLRQMQTGNLIHAQVALTPRGKKGCKYTITDKGRVELLSLAQEVTAHYVNCAQKMKRVLAKLQAEGLQS